MLSELHVRNFALVEQLRVFFAPDLNVITGETGAGKSILIGALDLALGGRGDRSLIRTGATLCQVDAVFELSETSEIDGLLAESGLPPCEGGQLLIRRQLSDTGSGRAMLNDSATTVHTLRRLGRLLVDMHGPHDQQSLLDPTFQLESLDAYGDLFALKAPCAVHAAEIGRLQQARDALGEDAASVAREMDLLAYEVGEIESAALTPEDEDELVQRHAEAANAEQMLALGNAVVTALNDGEPSAFDRLGEAQRQLESLAALMPDAAVWLAEARSIAVQIQELNRTVEARLQGIEIDPDRLMQLDARMSLVQKLKRKYGPGVAAILERLERSRARLEDLRARDDRLADYAVQIEAAQRQLCDAATVLSRARHASASKLGKAVKQELRDLGFARAEFAVQVGPVAPGPTGADQVEFRFAPNVGEAERSLRVIASSGEISRVMLALKKVLAAHDRVPVLVFDEIDANIGGETGHVVGRKMRQVAANHQVLCITHLPQVAVHGAHHLVVAKQVADGRTRTVIAALEDSARPAEIARMLGGDTLTPLTRKHAEAMLRAAASIE